MSSSSVASSSVASSSGVSSAPGLDAPSLYALEPGTVASNDAMALVVVPATSSHREMVNPAFIRAQTMMWKQQQDDEDAVRHAERMSQFRNCRSIIDLVSSKKIPQMKVKIGGGGAGSTVTPPMRGQLTMSVAEEFAPWTSEVMTSAGMASGPAEAAALARGCPSDRLSYLAIEPGLGSDDNYYNPVMDLGRCAFDPPGNAISSPVGPLIHAHQPLLVDLGRSPFRPPTPPTPPPPTAF